MKKGDKITISNRSDACFIDIEGVIGVPEEWQFDDASARVATYEKFNDAVRRIAGIEAAEVVVSIRSTGGDVNDALLIHDALRSLKANVTTRCYGYTASAATIIAQAASEGRREISENALYLIHNSICATEGNAGELSSKVDLLHKTDERLAGLYASRSGHDKGEFASLMAENNGNGRWLSPEEVVASGLADRIIDGERTGAQAASGVRDTTTRIGALLSILGISQDRRPKLPSDKNVFRFDVADEGVSRRDALDSGQQKCSPTATQQKEDPPAYEAIKSANGAAYDDDVRRIIGRR